MTTTAQASEQRAAQHERPWTDLLWTGVDLETTGLDIPGARIVTAAAVKLDPTTGDVLGRGAQLTHPGIPIPEQATAVHGITDQQALTEGRPYAEVYAKIRNTIDTEWGAGQAIVVYNAAYDLSIIHHEGLRLGYGPLEPGIVIDPLVIDRQLTRTAGTNRSRRLKPTADHHRVRLDIEHDATEDVLATLRILWKIRQHPAIGGWSSRKLVDHQEHWYRQRGEELREYYADHPEKGRDPLTVGVEWPVAQ